MAIFFLISIICITLICTLLIISFFVDLRINKYQIAIGGIIFAVSLSVIAYCTEPVYTDDLYRHFQEITMMKNGGLYYLENQAIYKDNFIINYFFYFISLIGNERLLPFFSIVLTYIIFFYIIYDFCKKEKVKIDILAIYIFMHFALCFLRYSISGVRNYLAFSIIALAIYREIVKNNKNIITYMLYIIPVFIHSSSLIFILLRVTYKLFSKVKIKYLMIFWTYLCPIIIEILVNTSLSILQDAGIRLKYYMNISNVDIRIMGIFLIVMIQMEALIRIISKRGYVEQHKYLKQYIQLLEIILLFTIGSIGIPQIFIRMCRGISFIMLPLIFLAFTYFTKNKKNYWYIINGCIILGLFTYQAIDAINYWTIYFYQSS